MEMESAAASTRFHQPHMERKMSAMTCEIFNELRLEGKLCDVVIKVNVPLQYSFLENSMDRGAL